MEHLADRLAEIPGVVAVSLGGSRARGEERPDSDWDFGLYYRGTIDTDAVRALGYEGTIVEPGEWGRLMNGGAWLTIDGERVDLLYRDLDVAEHWTGEADAGRFEIDALPGYLAGITTSVLAGELALGKVLAGDLPRPTFSDALRESAERAWRFGSQFSLQYAAAHAARGDQLMAMAMTARAVLEEGYARLGARGEWALNDKGVVNRAGVSDMPIDDVEATRAALALKSDGVSE